MKKTIISGIFALVLLSCDKEPCQQAGEIVLTDNQSFCDCELAGRLILDGENILVKNVKINADGYTSGIEIMPGASNVLIKNVEAYNASRYGIGGISWPKPTIKNVIIIGSKAHHNLGDPDYRENWSGSGFFIGGATGIIMRNCEAFLNGELTNSEARNGPVGFLIYNTDMAFLDHCKSYLNKTRKGHKDGGGFDFDGSCTNSKMQFCESWDNAGPGFLIWGGTDGGLQPGPENLEISHCKSDGDRYGLLIGSGAGQIPDVEIKFSSFIARTARRIDRRQAPTLRGNYFCGELLDRGTPIEINNTYCNDL